MWVFKDKWLMCRNIKRFLVKKQKIQPTCCFRKQFQVEVVGWELGSLIPCPQL